MKQLFRLEKAISYIEEHLDEDISVEDVANEVGYSYSYMTRLFAAILGEPLGSYINKRRLYNASRKLLYTDERVIDIAIESSFASPEAFSRAFKSIYGLSPYEYRKNGLDLVLKTKRAWNIKNMWHIAANITLTPKIVEIEEVKLLGIRGNTSIFENQLPKLWQDFIQLKTKYLLNESLGYCVCERPNSVYTEEGNTSFSVMIGCPVLDYRNVANIFVTKTVQAGKYAVFTHHGSFANLVTTYAYIFGTWLLSGKEEFDAREDFELYDCDIAFFEDPENKVQIYIPIK